MPNATATTSESVTFASRYSNLTLYLESPSPEMIGTKLKYTGGLKAQFDRGRFTTDDPKVIDAIRTHEKFGVWFDEVTDDVKEKAPEPKKDDAAKKAG